MRQFAKLSVIAATLVITACTSDMNLATKPNDADIKLFDSHHHLLKESHGQMEYKLKRGDGYWKGADYTMTVSEPGYQTQTVKIGHKVSYWRLGLPIVLGGPVGVFIVPPTTGSMWVLKTDDGQKLGKMNIKLEKSAVIQS